MIKKKFDFNKMMRTLKRQTRLAEKQNNELESMLDELNPNWREEIGSGRKRHNKTGRGDDMKGLIDLDVIAVLKAGKVVGNNFYLSPEQLDRNLYIRVNEVLSRLGGKWRGGKVQAHVFEDDLRAIIDETCATRIMPPKNPLGFFETPPLVVDKMLSKVQGRPKSFLEPSAGRGAIVRGILRAFPTAHITALELDPARLQKLAFDGDVRLFQEDFLLYIDGLFECVLINAPFSTPRDHLEYISHFEKAFNMLLPGGQFVGIAPVSLRFRVDKRTSDLRALIMANNGTIETLPPESFYDSGTLVSTVLVYMRKPKDAAKRGQGRSVESTRRLVRGNNKRHNKK